MKNTNWTNFGKRLIALSLALVTLLTIFAGVAVNAEAAAYDSYYFPKYTGKSGSIVTALSSVGVDSSYSFRSKIAAANNITGYRGSASQNTQMLNLLKNGKLKRPETSVSSNTNSIAISYYETAIKTTLKSEPYDASSSIVSIPKNSTIMVSQNVTNKYGNRWYKALVYCNDGIKEGYVYSGKVTSHTHSYKSFTFNEVTYKICRCGDVKVSASSSAKVSEGKKVAAASTAALPLALGAVDGPLPIGDLIGVGILIVGTCFAHDILAPTTVELAEMITKADFDEYLQKKDNVCNANSFRKVQRVGGKLKYIDKHCLDIVEAYIYCRFLGGDVYTLDENNALLLAAMHGSAIMERDKDKITYYYHYHFGLDRELKGHIFFGANDRGETPS